MKLKKTSQKRKKILKKKTLVKKAKSPGLIDLDQKIWPVERDVFFRPARLKYVRKLIQKKDCVFCPSKENQADGLRVYKTQLSQIVINKFPYNSGHVLILPLRHCGNLLDLSAAEYDDLMQTVKTAVKAVTDIYNPQGYNIGLNNGSSAGAGIPDHLHFHLVPRWNGDLNFFPLIAETKLVIENVEDTMNKFVEYFKAVEVN